MNFQRYSRHTFSVTANCFQVDRLNENITIKTADMSSHSVYTFLNYIQQKQRIKK